MTEIFINPSEAKDIAKAMFGTFHPNRDMWFDIAWEVLEENDFKESSSISPQILAGLAASGESPSETSVMADDLAMFFEAFMLKNPIRGIELAQRIQSIAEKRSTEIFNRESMVKRFSGILKDEAISSSTETKQKFDDLSEIIKNQFAETNELIKNEHQETRGTVRRPIISSKFNFNCLLTLYSATNEVSITSGYEETNIKLSRMKFSLLMAIAKLNKKTYGWLSWDEITDAVPGWTSDGGKTSNYVRHRIAELRKELSPGYADLIESRQSHGYRISTHPDNITIV